jgi:hypothetical protein
LPPSDGDDGTPGKKPPAPSASRHSRYTRVGRIYLRGDPRRAEIAVVPVRPSPRRPPNSGMTDTLEEAKAQFKRRYQQVNGRT